MGISSKRRKKKKKKRKKRRKKRRRKKRNIYQTNAYGVLSVGSEETKWISGPTIPKLEIHTPSFCFLSVLTYTHLSPPPYNLSTPNPPLSCLSWHTHISHLHPVIHLSLIGWIHDCPFFLLSFSPRLLIVLFSLLFSFNHFCTFCIFIEISFDCKLICPSSAVSLCA